MSAEENRADERTAPRCLRIVDRGPSHVRWIDVDTGERGVSSHHTWDAALRAGDIIVTEDRDIYTNT